MIFGAHGNEKSTIKYCPRRPGQMLRKSVSRGMRVSPTIIDF